MKKLLSLMLSTILLLTAVSALAEATPLTLKVGELTYLNSNSTRRTELLDQVRGIAVQKGAGYLFGNAEALEMVEFDSLNSMQMALDAGQIDAMVLYSTVGNYLAAVTGKYSVAAQGPIPGATGTIDLSSPTVALTIFISDAMLGTDFSFMMREKDAELRDEFDQAITAMLEDGVLAALGDAALVRESGEPAAVEMPMIEGAETIKVGVTGDLPPFDFMDASGKPAGFNTAILAEISKRINKNIELVSIDSASRALALTSGSIDVVFWARVGNANSKAMGIDTEVFPEEMKAILDLISATGESVRDTIGDIPEGTILTMPYMHDISLLVYPKK